MADYLIVRLDERGVWQAHREVLDFPATKGGAEDAFDAGVAGETGIFAALRLDNAPAAEVRPGPPVADEVDTREAADKIRAGG